MHHLFSGIKEADPPRPDQVEISIFGPGYGECVLVHLGNNYWINIDSCVPSGADESVALTYLNRLRLDPADAIKFVVVSHWHDDHIRGLSQIVKACPKAIISSSLAMGKEEFIAYVSAYKNPRLMKARPGPREIQEVLQAYKGRGAIRRAGPNRKIDTLSPKESGHGHECNVYSLSPSDGQIDKFLYEISALMPSIKESKRRALAQTPNDVAIVLWIEIGDVMLLLGADLEETNDPETGWSAIVASREKPRGRASVFKVPHHGSANGHNPNVWSDMLVEQPFALLTPFVNGDTRLPRISDVRRICNYTPKAFITSTVKQKSTKKRLPAVDRQIRETAKQIRLVNPPFGMIRMRTDGDVQRGVWSIERFGNASPLASLL